RSLPASHGHRRALVSTSAALVVGLLVALVIVVRSNTSTSVDHPPTTVGVSPATTIPATTTPAATTPATTTPATTAVAPTTSAESAVIVDPAFGDIAPIADATILHLPDPMPQGWLVSGVVQGTFPDEGSTGDLEAVPPVEDGTFHEFLVWLTKSDGTALARLSVTEYPAPGKLSDYLAGNAEEVQVGGVARAHFSSVGQRRDTGLGTFAADDAWAWVQNGRRFEFQMVGAGADLEALMTSVQPVTGVQLAAAILDGQRAALQLPVIASADLASGVHVTARGAGTTVLALCAEFAPPTCGFIGVASYDHPDVLMTVAASPTGPQNIGWVPTRLVGPLAPGPTLIDGGPLGSFVTGFSILSTVGVDTQSGLTGETVVGWPRTDLLGMPDIDRTVG
ncbi:MAG: hypothetical protein JWN99_2628, partial [Ilumatobacteraceae bacterium]|nr:hypothetical protein [Ilumatobacteraceae bacterium]